MDAQPAARKNITQACNGCKVKKKHCSGDSPCISCTERSLPCIFEEPSDDKRRFRQERSDDVQRRLQELEERTQTYDRLFACIKESSDDEVAEIMAQLKSNKPPADILDSLDAKRRREHGSDGLKALAEAATAERGGRRMTCSGYRSYGAEVL